MKIHSQRAERCCRAWLEKYIIYFLQRHSVCSPFHYEGWHVTIKCSKIFTVFSEEATEDLDLNWDWLYIQRTVCSTIFNRLSRCLPPPSNGGSSGTWNDFVLCRKRVYVARRRQASAQSIKNFLRDSSLDIYLEIKKIVRPVEI